MSEAARLGGRQALLIDADMVEAMFVSLIPGLFGDDTRTPGAAPHMIEGRNEIARAPP